MKLEKEQKTQFIVLAVLLVVVIGFGAYRMAGTGTSANSQTPKPAAATAPATTGSQPSSAAPADEPAAEDMTQVVGFVPPVKDPFEPHVLPSDLEEKPVANVPAPKLPVIVRETDMRLPIMPTFSQQPVKTAPAMVEVQEDPTKGLKLTGVIEGDSNIAIIRAGDARHFLREGQSIDGRIVVRSISRAGVRLNANGRSYFLVLSSGKES